MRDCELRFTVNVFVLFSLSQLELLFIMHVLLVFRYFLSIVMNLVVSAVDWFNTVHILCVFLCCRCRVEKKERARLKSIKFQAKPEKVCDSVAPESSSCRNGDTILLQPAGNVTSLSFESVKNTATLRCCCFHLRLSLTHRPTYCRQLDYAKLCRQDLYKLCSQHASVRHNFPRPLLLHSFSEA